MSLKKILDENHKLHIFFEKFSSEGWKFLKTIKTVTQILETRNYWLRALSDVKQSTSDQCDLHFNECLEEYLASLNLRNFVWAR